MVPLFCTYIHPEDLSFKEALRGSTREPLVQAFNMITMLENAVKFRGVHSFCRHGWS